MSTLDHNIFSLDAEALKQVLLEDFSEKPYRQKQIFDWVYRKKNFEIEQMSNIALDSRRKLKDRFSFNLPLLKSYQESIDGTIKFLVELEDGAQVESVLIAQPKRYTLCISSQVGCAIGCKFCRTALMGLKRHLKTEEIVGQVMAILKFVESPPSDIKKPPQTFKNIVFMGMGEPLHNTGAVFPAVRILTAPGGLQFSPRRITISTSGLVPKIEEFAKQKLPASLAVSLNATTNEVRDKLMPLNKRWPIEELIESLKFFAAETSTEVTAEYVMLEGVNDSERDMKRLLKLLRFPVKLNLIPYNNNSGLGFKSSSKEKIINWQRFLVDKGLNTRVRWSKGEDISAACGQLAVKED